MCAPKAAGSRVAKRMECVELAPAVACPGRSKAGASSTHSIRFATFVSGSNTSCLSSSFGYPIGPMSKLLLIDDEADVQYSFQRIFDSPEIELTTASSGEEGLKIIPKLKPDLVMMDVRMGGITGLETLRRIRQIDSKLLVI